MQVKIGQGELNIIQGDIAEQNTQAIVNAANNHLWMSAGVAGAIKRKGGETVEREAVAQGPIEVGQAVLTSGGTLQAKYVIHAAAMGQDLQTDHEKIKSATRNSLTLADERRISSISFPALGTGVGGFPPTSCAKIMLREAVGFLKDSKHLRTISFVLFDQKTLDAFEQELKTQFPAK